MKKIVLGLVVLSSLVSCSNDDSSNNSLVGVWKKSKEELVSGKDKTIIETFITDDCEKKGTIEIFNNGQYKSTRYSTSNQDCLLDGIFEGTCSYNANTKKLTMDGELKDVLSLTSNEFVYVIETTNDQNGDGIDDYYVSYLIK